MTTNKKSDRSSRMKGKDEPSATAAQGNISFLQPGVLQQQQQQQCRNYK